MSTLELYAEGAKVWVPDAENIWKCGEVLEHVKDNYITIQVEDGETLKVAIDKPDQLPPLKNPEIFIGENDLTSLSYLHEPAVLNNLKIRFCNHNAIYTYCGIVLVAINPYEDLPIYNTDTIMAYQGQAMGDLDPHIFALAGEAYIQMERENQNQSIILSGESGAGKTMSAKHAMRYFATVGGSSAQTHVEKKVRASNPIMEAIGNAKTTRNDNSSRFGKYIELDFNSKYKFVGVNMRTYLLEKSRVVIQAVDERNYHIFYQLCAAAKDKAEDLEELQLGDCDSFHYTNQGQSPVIPSVNDAHSFKDTKSAFTLFGFSDLQWITILKILAAILHLGNVQFLPGEEDAESSFVEENDRHLVVLSELLGVDATKMSRWLCRRKIKSRKEVITKPMPVEEASFSRDALAKHIYAKLFDWIVSQINKSLVSDDEIHHFIGVLDIYGFETLETNSFEQFCINYADEKLQQQFNQHVFKLEQEEYFREKIKWNLVEYYDNQPCIDLIESKLGILDLLDEECRMPKGRDQTWCQKLFEKCKKWEHFEKPILSETSFLIRHFADKVTYDSSGFLEKNRDTVMEEHINILKASQVQLVAELFEEVDPAKATKGLKTVSVEAAAQGPGKSRKQNKKTVGLQFKESLGLLMATLNATTPHYVRCIKPNDDKEAFKFDPKRAVQQLRACGVLETVKISAARFPSRLTYSDFLNRHGVLGRRKDVNRNDLKLSCQKILENVIKEEDKFQFGKTKIFFRAGQVAYLEKLRADKLRTCALIVIKHIRGWVLRKKYVLHKKVTLRLQCRGRGFLARKKAQFLRCTKAAIKIQKCVKGWLQRTKYNRMKRAALIIQTHARGKWARERFLEMRRNAASIVIQKNVRCFLAKRRYQKNQRRVVICQSAIRRFLARGKLKKLKVEARSVEHIKKLNKGLENKIISLQHKIEELSKENKTLKRKEVEVKQLTEQLEQSRHLESEVKQTNNKVLTLEEELASLRTQLSHLQDEKKDWITEKATIEKERDLAINSLTTENSQLKANLDLFNEEIKIKEKGTEEILRSKIENEKKMLMDEFESERKAYQKLMREYARMEQRCESMQSEMSRVKGGGGNLDLPYQTRKRTASDISLLSIQTDATEVNHDDVSDTMDSELHELEEEDLKRMRSVSLSSDPSNNSKEVMGIEAPVLDLSGEEHDASRFVIATMKRKEAQNLGMFEYRKEDEPVIIGGLIHDLKPEIAVSLLPGLPAYIMFMCIRHADHINDDEKLRSLLNSGLAAVEILIWDRYDDIEYPVLWLANICRLLHNLKQYSGDAAFQTENTPKQNEQRLRNFDLSDCRQVLSDVTVVWIYQAVIEIMEENVEPLIVPAVLEHEASPGISGNKPQMRRRSSSVARKSDSHVDPQKAMGALLRELDGFYLILNLHHVDPELVTLVFKQLFYFICAGALNNLLLRKDMCHWSKGRQIRCNLGHLEQWCMNHKIDQTEVTKTLDPIIQASQLLQARKSDEDVPSVCAMCDKLTTSQVLKILNLYTPADDFEKRVPVSFTSLVQACLQERDEKMLDTNPLFASRGSSTFLMDTKLAFPISFPFNPSSVCLEDIYLPEVLNLSQVLKKV